MAWSHKLTSLLGVCTSDAQLLATYKPDTALILRQAKLKEEQAAHPERVEPTVCDDWVG